MALKSAIAELENGRPVSALLKLLDVWRESRDSALPDQIDRLGGALAAAVPFERGRSSLETAWNERFATGHPTDVPLLASTLFTDQIVESQIRAKRLTQIAPDPRVTAPLLDWLTANVDMVSGSRMRMWRDLLGILEYHGDPRVGPALMAILLRPGVEPLFGSKIRILAGLSERQSVDLDGLAAAIDAFLDRVVITPELAHADVSPIAGRLRDCAASHDSVLVWWDHLLEQGHPLARWVALQLLERKPTEDEAREMENLARQHRQQLLGDLDGMIVGAMAFERAQLVRARVSLKTEHQKTVGIAHPRWRSLRQVDTSIAHLRHPVLTGVERVGVRLCPSDATTGRMALRTGPPGFELLPGKPPSWTLLGQLAKSGPAALRAVCVALPTDDLTEGRLGGLEGLGLDELHLVDNSGGEPSRRLGPLASHIALRSPRRLVLDGFAALPTDGLFTEFRSGGQELVVIDDFDSITVQSIGDELVVTVTTTRHLDRMADLLTRLGDPSSYARIRVVCSEGESPGTPPEWRDRSRGVLEHLWARCPDVAVRPLPILVRELSAFPEISELRALAGHLPR